MMNPSKQLSVRNSVSASMPLKLAGLFAGSFALFFMLFFAYDLLSGFAERAATTAAANDQTRPIVVDPKIADDLANVLAADANPYSQDVKDPFMDRGGLSGKAAAATNVNLTQNTAPAAGSRNTASVPQVPTVRGGVPGNMPPSSISPPTAAVEGTKQRYETWLGHLGVNGDAPLDPRVFAIEDLLPVGIVDGGNGQQEVMFFSQAANKTVSFPVGTMFFDGWLTELRPEGVVFSSNDDRRTVRMRSWARSVKNAG